MSKEYVNARLAEAKITDYISKYEKSYRNASERQKLWATARRRELKQKEIDNTLTSKELKSILIKREKDRARHKTPNGKIAAREANIRRFLKDPFKHLLIHAKHRAEKFYKISFDLDIKYIEKIWNKQNGKCFYTNLEMVKVPSKRKEIYDSRKVSIDRINSNRGYIKGNVVLCCSPINIMKSGMSIKQFNFWCNSVSNLTIKK